MNRILKRPMFRMGGSPQFEFQEKTTGVLSGLDGPKLNASRTGLANGGNPNKDVLFPPMSEQIIDMGLGAGGGRGMQEDGIASLNITEDETETEDTSSSPSAKKSIEDRIRENVKLRESLYREYGVDPEKERGAPGSLSSALMTFGLNLLAQPGGNLAGAIGKAGSPALKQFQQARMAERLRKGERKRDMIDEAIRGEQSLEEERIEAQGAIDEALAKASGTTDKSFQFQAKFDRILETKKQMRDLEKKIAAGQDPDGKLKDDLAGLNAAFQDLVGTDPALEAIYKSDFMNRQIDDITDKFIEENDRPPTTEELLKILRGKKDGGRVEYAEGGEVMEEMTETVDMVTGQGQTQDLTYRELRSRLPREITNDVVSLIATSKQALTDFANIQTQQDVDNFNSTYNVNLVLPQEG
jgi:hypothetical protein